MVYLYVEYPGQMEVTFMNQVSRATNLRPILQHAAIQETMKDVISGYSKIANEDSRGTRNRDALSLQELTSSLGARTTENITRDLDANVFQSLLQHLNYNSSPGTPLYVDENLRVRNSNTLFLHRASTPCKSIKIGGVRFQPKHLSLKDSNVVYSDSRDVKQIHYGSILHIFMHKRPISEDDRVEDTFLAVRRLTPLNEVDEQHDDFRRYPRCGGSLYYDEYRTAIDIVPPTGVLCHYARTPHTTPIIPRPCVHVLPLDRVRIHFLSVCSLAQCSHPTASANINAPFE